MAPTKCAYFMCNYTSAQKPMFRFPSGDPTRLQVWLSNCGNMTIAHLSHDELRNRYLCLEHFDVKFVQNKGGKRTRITKNALPKHYKEEQNMAISRYSPIPSTSRAQDTLENSPELKTQLPKKVYPRRNHGEVEFEESEIAIQFGTPKKRKTPADEDTPKCKKLKMSIKNTNALLKKEKHKRVRLQNKMNASIKSNKEFKHNFKSEASKTVALMQLKKTKAHWSEEEKKFCMSLYYKSPAAYKYLLQTGVVLAAPTTIQNWLQATNCLAGLNQDVLQNIQNKFKDRSIKEKACAVCFDEMSIKIDLEYTKKYDLIEGFEDFGGGDRSPKEAKYALVFVARGIYSNWKIPLAYVLSNNNVKAEKLIVLIKSIISELFMNGLLPKVIVCDQATTNQKAIKSLGATKDDPFFFIDDHKLFAIFDAPHLIKNIRNNLLDSDYELNGNVISFSDIINVYNIDKNNKSKSLRKLTPVHIQPNNFQKMKVKFATQVLSNSVAAAIETAITSGELKSDSAKNTADFVRNMNDLFDSLNSKNQFNQNPCKCAISKNKNSSVYKSLKKGLEIFKDLKKIHVNKNNEKKMTSPPCFEGMQQTINAVLQLSTEEFSPGTGVNFLMTYRLNQDVIENLFGIYRMRGGCNQNPTSKSLRAIFRSNLLNNLIKLDKSNCEADDDNFLSTSAEFQQQNTQPSTASPPVSNAGPSTSTAVPSEPPIISADSHATGAVSDDDLETSQAVTLEDCSVVYFAGWLGKVCVEKFDCSACTQALLNDEVDLLDKRQLLLINKTYSNLTTPKLKSPTDFLYKLINQMLNLFNNRMNVMHETNLVSNLMTHMKNNLNLPNDYHNITHLDFLMNKLLEVKIHDFCKMRKKCFEGRSKLKILQHK